FHPAWWHPRRGRPRVMGWPFFAATPSLLFLHKTLSRSTGARGRFRAASNGRLATIKSYTLFVLQPEPASRIGGRRGTIAPRGSRPISDPSNRWLSGSCYGLAPTQSPPSPRVRAHLPRR